MSEARSDCPGAALCWNDQSDFPLDWNGPIHRPFEAFPDESKARPIIELLRVVVGRFPERVALCGSQGTVTYAELWRALSHWAEQIAGTTAPGDLVGILAAVSPAFPIGMLACLAAGRPFVALDPGYPPEWIAQVLEESRPTLLLVSNAGHAACRAIPAAVSKLDLKEAVRPTSPGWRPAHLSADEPACVLFTSGSTGQPKGIVNSQRNLLQRVSQSINAAHVNSDDRFLTLAPLCTIVGVRDMLTALLAGASFHLLDVQNAGTREIHTAIGEQGTSILFAFPALLRSLVEGRQGRAGDSLRLVRVGGDTTLWSDVARLRGWVSSGTSIQLVYAATEAPMMQWFIGAIAAGDEERVPIGYPLPDNALAVVDENGAPTPEGEVGELLVRSPYVALGSWSQGRCQAAVSQTDSSDRSLRIFRTGDLVRCRSDGLYDRIGRKDRQVKIRGVRVELEGVEAAIRRHPAVRDVGVVARTEHHSGVAKLVAYVQPRQCGERLRDTATLASVDVANNRPTAHTESDRLPYELGVMMRRLVPGHMRPWRYYVVPTLPRLPNSKLDSRGLLALDLANSRKGPEECFADCNTSGLDTDPTELMVARIWREILGLRLTAPEDDFFDLGGNSLHAITMTHALEKALDRELPINLINQAPTFAAFCATLKENVPAAYTPLVLLKPGHGPPLFFIHGVGGCVMELFGVCRRMTWPGPVFGIQARGMDGRDPPHDSVEAMADEYLAAVRKQQPQGPYFLCGYSFGGLVAFELARRLSDTAEEVAFVGLLATLPPGHHLLRLWTWMAYLYRRLAQAVAELRSPPLRAGLRHATMGPDQSGACTTPSALRAVALSALSASAAYHPGTYRGELTIFEPGGRDLGVPASGPLWSRHASAIRIETLKGRHDDMLEGTNAQAVADLLTRCLESAA